MKFTTLAMMYSYTNVKSKLNKAFKHKFQFTKIWDIEEHVKKHHEEIKVHNMRHSLR